ncbi:MAG: hypothetical protein A2428_11070 [Bdellovibrionales bacterium RIFOXYC1_FULL_54_43]|nr:MAG: hypothetical protein A2428_11070 [Bdellovibrionales bacterium RIFOXYC1_FULL_54_43]OFZ84382.1 MAG: hypothetical protein A2603_16010 [Bdellovibrionales bacterium RIFOXYD1_FULL_55_31]
MRAWSTLLALSLALLWIVGLADASAAGWLSWMNLLASIAAFIVSGLVRPGARRELRSVAPLIMSFLLFGLWALGSATNGLPWQNWWDFFLGCCFLIAAAYGYTGRGAISSSRASTRKPYVSRNRRYKESA